MQSLEEMVIYALISDPGNSKKCNGKPCLFFFFSFWWRKTNILRVCFFYFFLFNL